VQVVQILQSHENRIQTAYSAKACINPKAANCVLGFSTDDFAVKPFSSWTYARKEQKLNFLFH